MTKLRPSSRPHWHRIDLPTADKAEAHLLAATIVDCFNNALTGTAPGAQLWRMPFTLTFYVSPLLCKRAPACVARFNGTVCVAPDTTVLDLLLIG